MLVLLCVCIAVAVFETTCLWDGSAIARCFDRPLVARLFAGDAGKAAGGDLSETAPTGPQRHNEMLVVAQLILIMLGAFTLDVLFTAVATFLPGRAR